MKQQEITYFKYYGKKITIPNKRESQTLKARRNAKKFMNILKIIKQYSKEGIVDVKNPNLHVEGWFLDAPVLLSLIMKRKKDMSRSLTQ